MSFQWSLNLPHTLKNIHSQLSEDGILAFSLPVDSTFKELKSSSINQFHFFDDIRDMLNQASFTILDEGQYNFVTQFDSPLSALRSIKHVGANYVINRPKQGLYGKGFLREIFNPVGEASDTYNLTYNIAFFIAGKK